MRRILTIFLLGVGVICAAVSAPTGGAATLQTNQATQKFAVTLKARLTGYEGPSRARSRRALVMFSPDSRWLALSSKDRSVSILDARGGTLKATLTGDDGIGGFSFSPDGQYAATRNFTDKAARLWDTREWKLQATLSGRKRNLETKAKTGQAAALEEGFGRVPFSPDGRFLLAEREDDLVEMWDVATRELIATLDHYTEGNAARTILDGGRHLLSLQAVYSGNGKIIATCNGDKQPKIWDGATGKLKTILNSPERIYRVALSRDGNTLATMQLQGAIELWDTATGRMKQQLEGKNALEYDFHGFEFSPDGQYISTFYAETTKLWEATGQLKYALPKLGKSYDATFTRDSKTLATASTDHQKAFGVVWDVATGAAKFALPPASEPCRGIGFSPDMKLLITVNSKGVKLWNAANGTLLADLQEARSPIAFSRDGRFLATGARGEEALLWELPSDGS